MLQNLPDREESQAKLAGAFRRILSQISYPLKQDNIMDLPPGISGVKR
ncbi:MAG: hypothetical protein ACKVT0_09175 [Planctomycetaceae bacterium]